MSRKTRVILLLTLWSLAGCGVRGKPQPPLTPPELGRGQPTFRRATEEFAFPNVPAVTNTPEPKRSKPEPGSNE